MNTENLTVGERRAVRAAFKRGRRELILDLAAATGKVSPSSQAAEAAFHRGSVVLIRNSWHRMNTSGLFLFGYSAAGFRS